MTDEHKAAIRAGQIAAKEKRDAAKAAEAAIKAAEPTVLTAQTVQVRGALLTIKVKSGKVYTVPADESEDYQLFNSDYNLSHFPGHDPEHFAYQFENAADVAPLLSKGWEIVERAGLGAPSLPAKIANEYGLALDTAYMANGQVCLQRLKILDLRERAAYDRFAKGIAGAFAPPKDSAKRALEGQKNGLVTEKMDSKTSFREPSGHPTA